jgi:hypothetical protein
VNGIIVLSSHTGGSLPFLNHEFTLWDKSMADSLHSDANVSQKKKSDHRLASGQHNFPFSFPFPTYAVSSSVLNANSISPFRPHTVGNTLSNVASPSSDNSPKYTEKPQTRWTRSFTSAPDEPPSSTKLQTLGHPHTQPRHSCASSIPPTFMEKDIDPNVAYDISVRIVHGRFKASSK